MPVKLWTGKPGAGKTANMVAAMLQFKKENPHRPIYAVNINGLHESVAQPITREQLHRWWELPPEALICIDEAQEDDAKDYGPLMPQDGGKPAEWVRRISKVRHEGMDFWLCTQHPNLISSYVRRLVDDHTHFERKFNTGVVASFKWARCMENCEKPSAQKVATSGFVTLPKEVFDLYKSSNAHNMKRKIPLKAFVLPVAAVVAIGAVVALPFVLNHMRQASAEAAGGKAAQVDGKSVNSDLRAADRTLRSNDYAKWLKPRVDGLPWTAPAFDDLAVKTVPRLFCIAVDDGRCTCHTEQGTRYEVALDRCRRIVADGLYTPFVGGLEEASLRREDQRRQASEAKPRPVDDGQPSYVADEAGPRRERATAKPYTPPTYGNWNSDPWGGSQAAR